MFEEISVAIFCGGKSTRMGQDKARLLFEGETFLQRLVRRLEQIGTCYLSVRTKEDYSEIEKEHVQDQYQDCGPIGGLHAILQRIDTRWVFAVSCDSPFVDRQLVRELFHYIGEEEEIDAVVPIDQSGRKYALCALYRKERMDLVKEQLEAGNYRMQDLLNRLKIRYVPVEQLTDGERKMSNINTKDQYDMIKDKIPVYSFVAYSGTGKTTYLEKLVQEFQNRGKKIAVIKHDGHDFEIDKEGKDTWRMTKAGAHITGIISNQKAVLMENHPVDAEEFIGKIQGVDLILTEGFKQGKWPKIMLYREAVGKGMPLPPDRCVAVVSDDPVKEAKRQFGFEQIKEMADFLIEERD